MERIGHSLDRLLRRLGVTDTMHGWRAVELWAEVGGERVAHHARAVGFRDGVLTVEVDSPAWMNELAYLRRRFAAELNRKLGEDVVRDIHLRPAAAPAPRRPAGSTAAGSPPPQRKP